MCIRDRVGDIIDYGAEWRNDTEGKDNTRCGMPIDNLLPETSISSGAGLHYYGYGKKIYADIQRTCIHNSQPYEERSLKERFDNIALKCRTFAITPAIIEYTQSIYYDIREALDKDPNLKRKRGNNDQGLQAAALYHAFQQDGHPKTYREIAQIFHINPDYVSDGIKLFKYLTNDNQIYETKTNQYSDYINGYCDRLHLDLAIKRRVIEVANKANKLGILDSNTPTAIVAGCIYYVIIESGIASINKETIKRQCRVSIPTITKVCDKLYQHTIELA